MYVRPPRMITKVLSNSCDFSTDHRRIYWL